jgi:hypothetical protein
MNDLSLWALCEGNLEGGAPLLGTLNVKKPLVTVISFQRGSTGENGREPFTRDFDGCLYPQYPGWGNWGGVRILGTLRISWTALAMEHVTLWEIS